MISDSRLASNYSNRFKTTEIQLRHKYQTVLDHWLQKTSQVADLG